MSSNDYITRAEWKEALKGLAKRMWWYGFFVGFVVGFNVMLIADRVWG